MNRPLCFVLMPFGVKPDFNNALVNFDVVYRDLIAPAIVEAELEPLRADEEVAGGIIHKPMFERLILCEYAVADLTTANANVFYELGLRHAVRPSSTISIFSDTSRLPFDVAPIRALPYKLNAAGEPANLANDKQNLVARLTEAKRAATNDARSPVDSPIFQLVEDFPDTQRLKTDVFRERVRYSTEVKNRLTKARGAGVAAVREIEHEIGDVAHEESGVVIDMFLSYRAVSAWQAMIDLTDRMSRPLAATVLVQEQLALALNRVGRDGEAEHVLSDLIARRGASSETCGILGRVYKDRWVKAVEAGDSFLARGWIDKAIAAYKQGFEADWRDAYPGINLVTLMEIREPPDANSARLIPVVTYAVERRIASGKPDYWDYATLLELSVLARDETRAVAALGDALACMRERWEAESTAYNLRLIREARARRGENLAWTMQVEDALKRRARADV
ncbi:MAG: DUF4071 domain-containing protein [Pyrinomonadaceae bacterium MAG19_C2-C3]|nr:DUF4071 domain-containing protein [Pyrinomonadaceae bacterium MAG19_C2-C3]